MKSIFSFSLMLLLLAGCSYKHDNLYISSKKTTEQSVANTKKSQIMQNGKVQIFVTVTYLNSLKNKDFIDKSKEQFVVGFHFVNFDSKFIKEKLKKWDIKFEIGDEKHKVEAKKLDSNSPILNIIPASNPWGEYFLVQTRKIDKNHIDFSLKIKSYEKITLQFEKDY